MLEFVSGRSSPDLARGLLGAVAETSSSLVPSAILERWSQFTPALKTQAVSVLLSRDSWTNSLLDAMETDVVSISDLKADQVQRLSTLPRAEQKARANRVLSRSGRLPNPDREAVLMGLLPLTEKVGDVAAGKEVFVKNCAKCHKHGDLGESIGPTLTGFNVHPKSKILTEIIDPNRSVEGNFRVYTAELKSGKTLAGLLSAETQTAIELVDTEAKRHTVLREDLELLVSGAQSLMPEGLEKQMPESDLVNLLEFLAAKGKYVPLPLEKAATVVSTRGMFYSLNNDAERLIFEDWSPKTVGDVPFYLVDPRGSSVANVVLLHGPEGTVPPTMPKSVSLPCNTAARTIHMLSGVSGWGYPIGEKGSVSLIVRLHYASGTTEDHELKNGEEFADYIRRIDVPGSDFAFDLGGRQIRLVRVTPHRNETIQSIEFVKGADQTAPVIMAVTVETP
jgi:putative heme-binding domain-containing protein